MKMNIFAKCTTIYKASTSQGPTRPFRLWPQHSTFSTFSKGRSGKILAFIFFSKLKLAVLCAKRPMANLPAAARVILNIYYLLYLETNSCQWLFLREQVHPIIQYIYIFKTVILSWKFICDFSLHCKRVCSKIHICKCEEHCFLKSEFMKKVVPIFVAIGPDFQFNIKGPSDDIFWQFRSKILNFFRIRLSKVCERSGFFLSHFNDLSFSFGGWNKWLVVNLYLQLL